MTISELYCLLGLKPNAAASRQSIEKAQADLGGVLPPELANWFLEADGVDAETYGFDGRSEVLMWHFRSIADLRTMKASFPGCTSIGVRGAGVPAVGSYEADPKDYVIFCDQLYYCPYYCVNVRSDGSRFGEVLAGIENKPEEAWLIGESFDVFAKKLFANYDEVYLDK